MYIYMTIALLVWNIIVFSIYAIDKHKASKNKWRISENTLIACAFLMGGLGAFLGMNILRHKTKHVKFNICVPIALMINSAIVFAVVWFL